MKCSENLPKFTKDFFIHISFMCFFEPVSPCSTDRHVGSEAMQDLDTDSERPRRGARPRVVVAPTRLDKFLNHEDNRCVCAAVGSACASNVQ